MTPSGDQTIAGTKRFTSYGEAVIEMKSETVLRDAESRDESINASSLNVRDKNGNLLAAFRATQDAYGKNIASMTAQKGAAGTLRTAGIAVEVETFGERVFHAPAGEGGIDEVRSPAFAKAAMPSRYWTDNIMPLQDGSTYTAPATGYVTVLAYANGAGAYLRLSGDELGRSIHSDVQDEEIEVFIPVVKGETVTLYCNNVTTGSNSRIRFVKACAEE